MSIVQFGALTHRVANNDASAAASANMSFVDFLFDQHVLALQLEPEELAGHLVEHVQSASAGDLSVHNFVNGLGHRWAENHNRTAMPPAYGEAVAEAWAWLVREGLLVEKQMSEGWFFVSRRGRRLSGTTDVAACPDSFFIRSSPRKHGRTSRVVNMRRRCSPLSKSGPLADARNEPNDRRCRIYSLERSDRTKIPRVTAG